MSQREKKKQIRDYGKSSSKSTDAASTVATSSKSTDATSTVAIRDYGKTSSKSTDATSTVAIRDDSKHGSKSTDATSTVATKSKIEAMREQYKNLKIPESYLAQHETFQHDIDLDDTSSMITGIIFQLKFVAISVASLIVSEIGEILKF
jgi:hypothetical protein